MTAKDLGYETHESWGGLCRGLRRGFELTWEPFRQDLGEYLELVRSGSVRRIGFIADEHVFEANVVITKVFVGADPRVIAVTTDAPWTVRS